VHNIDLEDGYLFLIDFWTLGHLSQAWAFVLI